MKNRNYVYQQIINITPDSFSDGGEVNSPLFLFNKIIAHYENGIRFFDFGAQSTAPTSKPIEFLEEKNRFEKFFIPILKNIEMIKILNNSMLSFDSFRPETMEFLLTSLSNCHLKPISIYWNDVSGCVDEKTLKFLSISKKHKLILCHNLANQRENSADHFRYLSTNQGDDFLTEIIEYFQRRLSLIPSTLHHQVVIDPAFGFSKDDSQNIFLLKNLKNFVSSFSCSQEFLIGISRKRFLRHLSGHSINDLELLDNYQDRLFDEFLPNNQSALGYLRCHRCLIGKNYLLEAPKHI